MEKIKHELQIYERVPDFNTIHRPDFNPRRYISIQERVNTDPEFENFYINKIIEEGWYKLENIKSILEDEMKGRHFKYRLNGKGLSESAKGTFRSGGMVIGKNKDDENYLMYKAYNGCMFPLQLADVLEIYIKNPNTKIEGAKKEMIIKSTIYFKEPDVVTDFPVYLKSNLSGENIVVNYARSNYHRTRFVKTKKYEYASRTGDWRFQ